MNGVVYVYIIEYLTTCGEYIVQGGNKQLYEQFLVLYMLLP